VLVASVGVIGACKKSEEQPKPESTPAGCASDKDCKGDRVCSGGKCVDAPAKATSSAATQPAAASPTTASPTTASPAESAAAKTATVESAPVETAAAAAPGGRSKVPTVEEWNAVTKEVTVRGSSKLNCETKMVREWLRVSCRGKSFSGGEPTGVSVTKGGGRGDDYTFSNTGVASLVVRFVEGVDLEAEFSWSDASYKLKVFWPHGAPEPPAKAEFLGVP
jgi:hypothetical protein